MIATRRPYNPHRYPPAVDLVQPDQTIEHVELPDVVYLEVDPGGVIWIDGVRTGAYLTTTEAKVLRGIMSNAHVTTYNFLLSYLYGGRDEPSQKILTVFVHKVRKKLGEHGNAIDTAWGRGWLRNPRYVLVPETTSTVDIAISADLVDRLMLCTALPAEACIELAIRETVERLENQ